MATRAECGDLEQAVCILAREERMKLLSVSEVTSVAGSLW